MKNIDTMTKKELASQITRAKMKDANKNLMDNHNKAELQTMLKKQIKGNTAKPKPATKKQTTKRKTVRKKTTVRRTVKRRK